MAKKIPKCEAGIKVTECAYKRDLNRLGNMFNANTEDHKDFRTSLFELNKKFDGIVLIKLNGDSAPTPLPDVMKEIYHATLSLRKTNKLREALKDWLNNTKTGKLIETKTGRWAVYVIIFWMIISSLNTLGVKGINPVQIIQWLISHIKIG